MTAADLFKLGICYEQIKALVQTGVAKAAVDLDRRDYVGWDVPTEFLRLPKGRQRWHYINARRTAFYLENSGG